MPSGIGREGDLFCLSAKLIQSRERSAARFLSGIPESFSNGQCLYKAVTGLLKFAFLDEETSPMVQGVVFQLPIGQRACDSQRFGKLRCGEFTVTQVLIRSRRVQQQPTMDCRTICVPNSVQRALQDFNSFVFFPGSREQPA